MIIVLKYGKVFFCLGISLIATETLSFNVKFLNIRLEMKFKF